LRRGNSIRLGPSNRGGLGGRKKGLAGREGISEKKLTLLGGWFSKGKREMRGKGEKKGGKEL